MSQARVPSTSTPTNFETIFAASLKAYNRQTKKDIAAHPLATELQSCDSSSAIIAILRTQIESIDQSQGADDSEKWTKWLGPTVNVLFAFSTTLGNGVGVVSQALDVIYNLTCLTTGIPTRECNIHWNWSPTAGKILHNSEWPGMF